MDRIIQIRKIQTDESKSKFGESTFDYDARRTSAAATVTATTVPSTIPAAQPAITSTPDNCPSTLLQPGAVSSPYFLIESKLFHSTLGSLFCAYLKKQYLVDLTFSGRSRSIQIHKTILAANSFYFEEEFLKNPLTGTIVVNWLDDVILVLLIEFIYSGKVVIESDLVSLFLQAGRYLRIRAIESLEYPSQICGSLKTTEKCKFTPPVFFNKQQVKVFDSTSNSLLDAKHSTEKRLAADPFSDSTNFGKSMRRRGRPKNDDSIDEVEIITTSTANSILGCKSEIISTKSINLEQFINDSAQFENTKTSNVFEYGSKKDKTNNRAAIFYEISKNQFYQVSENDLSEAEECNKAVQDLLSSSTDSSLPTAVPTMSTSTFFPRQPHHSAVAKFDKQPRSTNHQHLMPSNLLLLDDQPRIGAIENRSDLSHALRSGYAADPLLSQSAQSPFDHESLTELDRMQDYGSSLNGIKKKRGRPRKYFNTQPDDQALIFYDLAKSS